VGVGRRGVTRVVSELLILLVAVGLIAIFFLWLKGWWDTIAGNADELLETLLEALWNNVPGG